MILIVATIRPHPGKAGDYVAAFHRLRENVREHEPGTVFFEIGQSRDDPGLYRAVEVYRDAEAKELHDKSAWLAQTKAEIADLLCEVDVQVHDTTS